MQRLKDLGTAGRPPVLLASMQTQREIPRELNQIAITELQKRRYICTLTHELFDLIIGLQPSLT